MARLEDSVSLLGSGSGIRSYAEIKCQLCGKVYNEGCDDGSERGLSDEGVSWAYFAGLQVAECCWDKIERSVYEHMSNIIPWYKRILDRRRTRLNQDEERLNILKDLDKPLGTME